MKFSISNGKIRVLLSCALLASVCICMVFYLACNGYVSTFQCHNHYQRVSSQGAKIVSATAVLANTSVKRLTSTIYFNAESIQSQLRRKIADASTEKVSSQGAKKVGPTAVLANTSVKPLTATIYFNAESIQSQLRRKIADASTKKNILVWYKTGMSGPGGRLDRETCGNCDITKNRSLLHDSSTGAVIFYYKDISSETMPPIAERNPDQLHVFWNKEPTPLLRYVHHKELDFEEAYKFNATMNYRRDSDFFNTYRYHWIRASFKSGLKSRDLLEIKNRISVAIVSDCDWTAGARLRYKILQKIKSLGFEIDTFGKCFPDREDVLKGDKSTVEKIRHYKFYFAIENSYHCADYITEKFYRNSLFAGAVPVVLGPKKEHYQAIAPPGSFIYMEDFPSLQELIKYLRYLDQNDTAYLEYHRWRQTTEQESSPYNERQKTFCHICRTLYGINVDDMYNPKHDAGQFPLFSEGVFQRIVPSLKNYLFHDEDEACMETNETTLSIYQKYGLKEIM